jgi:energy-coupling factor transport system substrate-specific component
MYLNLNIGGAVLLSIVFIIINFVILFETRNIDAKTMVIIAVLSALGGVLRVPFALVPGVNPVTFICAVSGYTLGSINGFIIGSMCAFISNFFLGQGPWTLWQMMGWGLCGAFFGILKNILRKDSIKGFIIFCGLWGYIFGVIQNQWYIVQFIRPITLKAIAAGIIASFWHDTLHAVGNVIFAAVFGKSFIQVLLRYNARNIIEYLSD